MPRSHYRVLHERYPHFITATVNNWLPLFTHPEVVNIVLNSWRFLQQNSALEIFGYVILENHLHLVARSKNLSNDIQRFKSYTAKEILAYLQAQNAMRLLNFLEFFKRLHKTHTTYQVWEEGSHPQIIKSEAVLRQKLDYIHQNPVKRGYIDLDEHWRYSSARNYAGQEGPGSWSLGTSVIGRRAQSDGVERFARPDGQRAGRKKRHHGSRYILCIAKKADINPTCQRNRINPT